MIKHFEKITERIYFTSLVIQYIFSTLAWIYYEYAKPYFVSSMSNFEQFILSLLSGFLFVITYLNLKGIIVDRKHGGQTE